MTEPDAPRVQDYPNCFGCGQNNPIGLRLKYRREGDRVATDFTPGDDHQGWPGIVHGGVIATLLYEVIENYAYRARGEIAMMRGVQIRFRRPAPAGKPIRAAAWETSRGPRAVAASAALTGPDGETIAEADAELVPLRQDQIKRLNIA